MLARKGFCGSPATIVALTVALALFTAVANATGSDVAASTSLDASDARPQRFAPANAANHRKPLRAKGAPKRARRASTLASSIDAPPVKVNPWSTAARRVLFGGLPAAASSFSSLTVKNNRATKERLKHGEPADDGQSELKRLEDGGSRVSTGRAAREHEEPEEDPYLLPRLQQYRFTDPRLARDFLVLLGLADPRSNVLMDAALTEEEKAEVIRDADERRGLTESDRVDGRFYTKASKDSKRTRNANRVRLRQLVSKLKEEEDTEDQSDRIMAMAHVIWDKQRTWTNRRRRLANKILFEEKQDMDALPIANAILDRASQVMNQDPSLALHGEELKRLADNTFLLPLTV